MTTDELLFRLTEATIRQSYATSSFLGASSWEVNVYDVLNAIVKHGDIPRELMSLWVEQIQTKRESEAKHEQFNLKA